MVVLYETTRETPRQHKYILKHYSSTLEKPRHEDCPVGKNSWCSYQLDVANKQNTHKPVNPFLSIYNVLGQITNCLLENERLAGENALLLNGQ